MKHCRKKWCAALVFLFLLVMCSGIVSASTVTGKRGACKVVTIKTSNWPLFTPKVDFTLHKYKLKGTNTAGKSKTFKNNYGQLDITIAADGETTVTKKLNKNNKSVSVTLEKNKTYTITIAFSDEVTGTVSADVDPKKYAYSNWEWKTDPKWTLKTHWISSVSESEMFSGQVNHKNGANTVVDRPSLTLNKAKASLQKKDTLQLKATVKNCEDTVIWQSSNSSVATVSKNGKVTAKASGTAIISATVENVVKSCTVTVEEPSITLNRTSVSLKPKGTSQLKAVVRGKKKKVTWRSSNSKVASVSKNGKITAKKNGKATITASANGVKASCTVTVSKHYSLSEVKTLLQKSLNKKYGKNVYTASEAYEKANGLYSFIIRYTKGKSANTWAGQALVNPNTLKTTWSTVDTTITWYLS